MSLYHKQNCIAERKHRYVVKITTTLMSRASIPTKFWPFAFTAVYLIKRLPSPNCGHKSPFEILFHKTPYYTSLKNFGCICYPLLKPYTSNKLRPKTIKCTFLGYALDDKACLCYNKSRPLDMLFCMSRLFHSMNQMMHLLKPKSNLLSPQKPIILFLTFFFFLAAF